MSIIADQDAGTIIFPAEQPRRIARWAGIFYLLVIIAPVSMAIRGGIIGDDALRSAHNLVAQATAWRLSVLIDFAGVISYIVVTALLYRLFRSCGRSLSVVAAFFSLAGCIVSIVGLLSLWMPLALIDGGQLAAFPAGQLESLALLPLKARDFLFVEAMSLFGLYCICIGVLILRASFIPKWLGPLMMLSGICYLIYCLLVFVAPPVAHSLYPTILMPGIIGEGALTLWLLAKGVDAARWHDQDCAS
jgi:hypothetical protein